jgi:hypothetical protein
MESIILLLAGQPDAHLTTLAFDALGFELRRGACTIESILDALPRQSTTYGCAVESGVLNMLAISAQSPLPPAPRLPRRNPQRRGAISRRPRHGIHPSAYRIPRPPASSDIVPPPLVSGARETNASHISERTRVPLLRDYPLEGVLICRLHGVPVIVGESGPSLGMTPLSSCGCAPASGDHQISRGFFVTQWGRNWWIDGAPPTQASASRILDMLTGQVPYDSPTEIAHTIRTTGDQDIVTGLAMWSPTLVDEVLGAEPRLRHADLSDGRDLPRRVAAILAPSLDQEIREICNDPVLGFEYVDYEPSNDLVRNIQEYDTLPALLELRGQGYAFHDLAREHGYSSSGTVYGACTLVMSFAVSAVARAGDLNGHPFRTPRHTPPALVWRRRPSSALENLRVAPPGDSRGIGRIPFFGDVGVVMCRRHHQVYAVDACGPWGISRPPCGCNLALGMHLVGGGGIVLVWGNSWHLPSRTPVYRDLVARFVAMGCAQQGLPWWDGVSRPAQSALYSAELDTSAPYRIRALQRGDVIFPPSDTQNVEILEYGALGVEQFSRQPPYPFTTSRLLLPRPYTCSHPSPGPFPGMDEVATIVAAMIGI